MSSLIDQYLPRFDVREIHRIRVRASPDATWVALHRADLARSPLVGALLVIRALPAALASGRAGLDRLRHESVRHVTLDSFVGEGFRILEERPPEELVIGLEGKFWRPTGDLCTPLPDTFARAAPPAGTARAVWNFRIVATAPTGCELVTETRVLCADAAARRRFLPYWWLIRPGSGLIRRAMLRSVRDTAEDGRRA
jgi:hypothetical protein